MDLTARVRRTIRRERLASGDTRVIAAVSGGSDSVSLAHVLHELAGQGELHLTAVAHFNHHLRDTADRDERFCRELAASLDVPLLAGEADVRGLAARQRRSIEDAARTARHAFFERVRVECGAGVVALGHTKDDQAETFLLRLVRGAGARGLASMHPRNGAIVRPLLDCRRAELRAYLADRHLAFVDDETNGDVTIPRNRVRAELLPLLERRFNPEAVEALAIAAQIARDEWTWMSAEAAALAARTVRRDGLQWTLDADALAAAPPALARLVVLGAMSAAAHGRGVSFDDVERTLDLLRMPGPPFDGPRQRVERIASAVVLTGRAPDAVGRPVRSSAAGSFLRVPLSIPGEVRLDDAGVVVSAEPGPTLVPASAVAGSGPDLAVVRRDRCIGELAVRYRRPGDRFHPPGRGGGKKLQDFFTDRKVERQQRDRVPLVVDAADRIVWVAGHAIDREFRVTDPAQAVIILRLKGLGGSV